MAGKRVVEEVHELCKRLEKEKDSIDAVVDVLQRFDELELSSAAVKSNNLESRLRKIQQEMGGDANNLAKKLLKKMSELFRQKPRRSTVSPADEVRRRVCSLLEGTFNAEKATLAEEVKALCVEIEAAMFTANGANAKSKEYKAKFRTLKFNLSKNSELRGELLDGRVGATKLVKMTAAELASSEKRKKRKEEQDNIFKASRSDWLDANRESINKQAGIKATGGLYKCFNCKSTKTTHYQKQTRSADEPMTVFVQCTNCGKRWRC